MGLRTFEASFKGSRNFFQANAVPIADLLPTPIFATLESHLYVCTGEPPRHLTMPGYFRRPLEGLRREETIQLSVSKTTVGGMVGSFSISPTWGLFTRGRALKRSPHVLYCLEAM